MVTNSIVEKELQELLKTNKLNNQEQQLATMFLNYLQTLK